MHLLTLVCYILDLIWLIQFHTFYDGRKVSRGIQRCPVGFYNDTWRYFLGIGVFFYIYHVSTLIFMGKTVILHLLYHVRDIWLCIRLTLPQIKGYIQLAIILLQVSHRYLHNVVPQCTVSRFASLKLLCCFQCFFFIAFIFLGLLTGSRIDLFQIADGKWCFFRIFSGIIILEINKVWLTLL